MSATTGSSGRSAVKSLPRFDPGKKPMKSYNGLHVVRVIGGTEKSSQPPALGTGGGAEPWATRWMLTGFILGTGGLSQRSCTCLDHFTSLAGVLETYLDDMKDMKAQVYDLFRQHPDLLPNVEEGLSKGALGCERLTCLFDGIKTTHTALGTLS